MMTQSGMGDVLGLRTLERPRQFLFLNGPSTGERDYRGAIARMIDVEVRSLLETTHDRVRKTLAEDRSVSEALAKPPLEREVLDREALTSILAAEPARTIESA